jgi:nucleotide-binding universal stress UspA family protein
MFKRILLCTDGSDRALNAAAIAAGLARTHGAELITLHVAQAPAVPIPFTGAPMIAEPLIAEYNRDLHRAVFGRTMARINEIGTFSETLEMDGDPVTSILRTAEAREVDLIVIGSRGANAARTADLGSVSYGVAHAATCPVLLVR